MVDKRINIVYIGADYNVANVLYLDNKFNIKAIICEKLRLTKELILFSEINNIKLIYVHNKEHFEEEINKLNHIVNNYMIFNFGIIITKKLLEDNNFFNIHPASLIINRGRNPIERALIENHSSLDVSIYKIVEKIDLGEFIDSAKVYIDVLDDNVSLSYKVNKTIPKLLNSLYLYIINIKSSKSIEQGIYYKPIKEEDFTIDLYKDSIVDIYNKIRSQKNIVALF